MFIFNFLTAKNYYVTDDKCVESFSLDKLFLAVNLILFLYK